MPTGTHHQTPAGFHPYHVVLISCAAPLFLGGLISDLAYARTYEIQWVNLAAWLIAGGMVFTGLALAWSFVEVLRKPADWRRTVIGFLLLLAMFVLGLLNSFMHARDAWGAMPMGLVQSAILAALAVGAIWFSVSGPRIGASA